MAAQGPKTPKQIAKSGLSCDDDARWALPINFTLI